MPIIAMTREMGSGAREIAEALARELDVPLIYHEIIDVLADKMRVRKSHVVRLLDGQANLFERLTADRTSLAIFTAAEICALAARGRGAIFRGWGAAQLLRGIPHVVKLRLFAPFELRKRNMMARLKTPDAAAVEREIRDSDEAQTALVRRNFGVDWTDAAHYDLVINTERVTPAQCVEKILALVRSAPFAETAAARQALTDLALQTEIRAALRLDPATRSLRVSVSVEAGRATLTGVVAHARLRADAERVARAARGATEVVNQLRAESEARTRYG